jgi:hypothetical protein
MITTKTLSGDGTFMLISGEQWGPEAYLKIQKSGTEYYKIEIRTTGNASSIEVEAKTLKWLLEQVT